MHQSLGMAQAARAYLKDHYVKDSNRVQLVLTLKLNLASSVS